MSKITMTVEFREDWSPVQFHGDPKTTPGWDTERGCAEAVAAYVNEEGIGRLLSDWNIDHAVDVWVGGTQVVRAGSVVLEVPS